MRAFIAIEIPAAVRAVLASCRGELQQLPAEASWTRAEQIHLTLRFLGDVDENLKSPLAAAMQKAAAGQPPFRLRLSRLGAFPNLRRPRVLWAGFEGELAAAQELQTRLDHELAVLGLPPEDKAWKPHLTLARLKTIGDPRAWAAAVERYRLPEENFEARRVVLFRSELLPGGARHSELAAVTL